MSEDKTAYEKRDYAADQGSDRELELLENLVMANRWVDKLSKENADLHAQVGVLREALEEVGQISITHEYTDKDRLKWIENISNKALSLTPAQAGERWAQMQRVCEAAVSVDNVIWREYLLCAGTKQNVPEKYHLISRLHEALATLERSEVNDV